MRIIFMGATELGWNCCRTLLDIGQEVIGIFTIPEQFRISWSPTRVTNVQYKSFEDLAEERAVHLVYINGKMSDPEYANILRELRPDIIVVVGWYYMLPRSLRDLAPLGAVGLHASLLPKYRGGAPLVWATIKGEQQTGVTFFHFGDGVDDGDVIGQASFSIEFEDDIAGLLSKASAASIELISRYVPLLAAGTAPRLTQNHQQATSVPQRQPEDGLIEWEELSARQTYDWIRAQTRPYPGAFTFFGDEKVTIWKARPVAGETNLTGSAGAIVPDSLNRLRVVCGDRAMLSIDEVTTGDRSMSGSEFAATRGVESGMKFTNQKSDHSMLHG
jgi:methionyl-tRNA formyltransferase